MVTNLRLFYKFVCANRSRFYDSNFRNISVTGLNLYPRILHKNSKTVIENNYNKTNEEKLSNTISTFEKEEEIANKVEANLFQNIDNKYNPPKGGAKAILNKYKMVQNEKKTLKKIKETPHVKDVVKKEYSSRIIEDNELGLTYTRLDLNHPTLSKFLMMVRSKKHRDKTRLILVEGRRLFLEAIECGLRLQTVLFSQKEQIALIGKNILSQMSKVGGIYKVPQHDLKIWSALTTPPGLIGIFERPTNRETSLNLEKHSTKTQRIPVTVICDNIREPNNLGSIIRTAAALPCSEVIILKGCCDPWESKALRGGCGGQFRILLRDDVKWENYIKELPQNSNIFILENNLNKIKEYGFYEKTEIYTEIRLKKEDSHNYIIIGGETHGISQNIYSSISQTKLNSKCLHIPLANGIESLNATSAATLLLFEIRKKYLQSSDFNEDEIKLDSLC